MQTTSAKLLSLIMQSAPIEIILSVQRVNMDSGKASVKTLKFNLKSLRFDNSPGYPGILPVSLLLSKNIALSSYIYSNKEEMIPVSWCFERLITILFNNLPIVVGIVPLKI